MGAASDRHAARRALRVLAMLGLAAALSACQSAPPPSSAVRAEPRHPIRAAEPWIGRSAPPVAASSDDRGRITPGPNSRVSPTPDMAPRVGPADRPELPSSRSEMEDLQRQLQQQREQRDQRRRELVDPGPPAGTIDRRPGTIRTTPGTVEVPR